MHNAIPEPSRRDLRSFGLLTGSIVAGLFGLFLPWVFERTFPLWPWLLLGVLGGLGVAVPSSLRWVYRIWMRFGLLASKVTTPIILGIVFFLIVSPMAFFRKIRGADAMAQRFDAKLSSYRVTSVRKLPESLGKPF